MQNTAWRLPIQVKKNIVTLRHMAYIAGELTKIQCGWQMEHSGKDDFIEHNHIMRIVDPEIDSLNR